MKNKKYTWECETCNKQFNSCILNGYELHDHLIDNVVFHVSKTEDNNLKFEYSPEWSDYFKKLNTDYFLNLAKTTFHKVEYVLVDCDNCGKAETKNKRE